MPQVGTPQLQSVVDLSAIVFGIALLIFIGVEAILLIAIMRFRDRGDGRAPATFRGNQRLEIAWTIVPFLILTAVFALTLGTMQRITAAPPDASVVRVIGHQFWWEFRYGDVVTANELHLPLGRTTVLQITSADVVHSFWIPELMGKHDAITTQPSLLPITPLREGTFGGACAEFCGAEHAWMLIRAIVEPADRFDSWLEAQRANAGGSVSDPGAQVFLTSTCVSCHTVRGTSAAGTAGPDLTHFGSRETLGAGVAPNDAAHLSTWVRDAQSLKPGTLMPRFSLSDQQVADLVRYLQSLK